MSRLPKVLDADEQQALLDQFDVRYWSPARNRTMVRFALATGLRASELVGLKLEHLDLDATGGRLVVRDGKGGKDRVVHFSRAIRNALRKWMERRDEEAPESEYLFPTRSGSRMSTAYLRKFVKREARNAADEIKEHERVSPHTLRHTAAVDLLRETGRLEVVQDFLGHADISTTRRYARLVNGEVEEACRHFRSGDEEEDEPDLEALLKRAGPNQLRKALLDVVRE